MIIKTLLIKTDTHNFLLKMIKKLLIILICSLVLYDNIAYCQEITWKAGFNSFFDNREYFNDYVMPQSILGARVFAEGGLAVDDYSEFSVGADFMYEFGAKVQSDYIKPILYYHYNKEPFEVYMGAFHRRGLFELPYVLQTDTFQYYRPNAEGIYIKAEKSWYRQDLWLDWTSRQTDTNRETFLIGGTGRIWKNSLFARYDFIMYHYAGPAIRIPNDHIRDNGGLSIIAGIDLSHNTIFDTLTFSTGFTMSYDRIRNVYDLSYRFGSLSELQMIYKGLGFRNTLYFGEGQIQMAGDGLYSARFYDRLDFIWNVFRISKVKAQVQFSLHFLPDAFDMSQKFAIYLDLGGRKKINPSMPYHDHR
jgi:hypothetical protein